MRPARKKPAIPLSSVPKVKELCEKLGFQHASSRQVSDFVESTHAFRKNYRTSSGAPGAELTDWNQGTIQHELFTMAIKFLDEAGNGERFWSDTRSWGEDGDLNYPEEKLLIAEILKQLFFKQNKYADNNQRYIERKTNESRGHSTDLPTPGPRSPSTATYRSLQVLPRASIETAGTSTSMKPTGPVISLLDDERSVLVTQMENAISSAPQSQRSDIFEFASDENENRLLEHPTTSRHTLTACSPKKSSGSQTTKVGSKKSQNNKPSPKSLKGSSNRASKAAPKRPVESPSRLSKRRRTATTYDLRLIGKDAENALDQYDMDEMAELNRLGEENNEDKERGIGEVQGDLRQQGPRPQARGLPNVTRTVEPYEQIHHVYGSTYQVNTDAQEAVGKIRKGFLAPVAPMIATSSPSNTLHAPTSLPTPPTQSPSASKRDHDANKPQPKVRGLFWIIAHSQPNKKIRHQWKNGQFKGKRLSTVIDEISAFLGTDPAEELNLKLETFLDETHVTVHRNDEKFWEETQRDFQKQIKEAFTRDRERGSHYKIWIEPLYPESAEVGQTDDADSEDFDW